MIHINPITDKTTWENFVKPFPQKTFLHSWNWGEFNEHQGDTIERLGMYEETILKGVALIITVQARRGIFYFCPHGPLLTDWKKEYCTTLISYLKNKKEKKHFIRWSPFIPNNKQNEKFFSDLGFRPAPTHMHAETTWELDIRPGEKELLAHMNKNHRNLIGRAGREGVTIRMSTNPEDIAVHYALQQETVERHGFVPFSKQYLTSEFVSFLTDEAVLLFFAEYKKQIIASALIIFYGDCSFYHHGASSRSFPKIPAAYLLQWKVIQEAKRRGCAYHNFWGVVRDPKNTHHPFYGLSHFKRGFGGAQKDYLHAMDFPLRRRYWLTFLFERIRYKKRGF